MAFQGWPGLVYHKVRLGRPFLASWCLLLVLGTIFLVGTCWWWARQPPQLTDIYAYTSHNVGMGNRMFIVASLLGIQKRHDFSWVMCFENDLSIREYFDGMSAFPSCAKRWFGQEFLFREIDSAIYDPRMEHLPTHRDVTIHGCLQSWKYLTDVEREVQQLFAFKQEIREEAETLLRDTLSVQCPDCPPGVTLVGIHVRRGDIMEQDRLVRKGYVVAPASYIEAAIGYFRRKLEGQTLAFVVVTQDWEWSRAHLTGPRVVFAEGGGGRGGPGSHIGPALDMALLTLCQHSIITVGTFGWWGAWLAGGVTVYYKDWPRPGSRLAGETNAEDYFPPHWIGLA